MCNLDRLGKTKDLLVCINSDTPRDAVFRVIDDSPMVSPRISETAERFATEMRRL